MHALGASEFVLIALAALAAGIVNAVAGGGTLITFPMMTALGIPPVIANVTNSVALCPGYLGGTLAQWQDLRGQGRRIAWLVPTGILGGTVGGLLLLHTGERIFAVLVPYLILLASLLLALQDPTKRWLTKRIEQHRARGAPTIAMVLPLAVSALYGGYFGAGLGVVMLAVLGITVDDTLTRLNALKQLLSLVINLAAAAYFIIAAPILWPAAAIMAFGALVGGVVGGRLAGRIRSSTLRYSVVAVGVLVGGFYLLR
ncbi:MAG: sulfite exporter TauE/SafE family protein [Gammaproteobacteria bacterium]|nr:sulfite exporter TauE/SafE family protein [Gammaproteobacteria bacterium]